MESAESSNALSGPRDRRSFLTGVASGAIVTVGLGAIGLKFGWLSGQKSNTPEGAESSTQASAHGPQGLFDRDKFAQYVHTKFAVQADISAPVELELVSVSPLKLQHVEGKVYESFSLLFTGPKSASLEQKIYPVKHGAMGNIELFLSWFGKPNDKNIVYYQTVFDRLV